jgi:DNA-binding NarL/FixJ family response regulator/uncharacterized LabA/DUF88 family protein
VADEKLGEATPTVLVVDHQPIGRQGLAGMLRAAGYTVLEARDGEHAVEIVASDRPELVIMDVLMPGISGIEATERIVTINPATRVLMLAEADSAETVRAALRAGAASYLTKTAATRDFLFDALRRTAAGERVFAPPGLVDALVSESVQPPSASESPLTLREQEIVALIATGAASSYIAAVLGLSSRTVENHLARIYKKLGVTSRSQLARIAVERHIDRYPWVGQTGTIMHVDIVGFSASVRSSRDQLALRNAMYEIFQAAFARFGIPWSPAFTEDRGDGMLIIIPSGVPIITVVDLCLTDLINNLADYNSAASESATMRLRISLHAGPVTADALGVSGEAIVYASRLVGAPVFREALQESGAQLGIVVSGVVYDMITRQGNLDSVPADLQSVNVQLKDLQATAWMWFSEYAPARIDTAEPDRESESGAPSVPPMRGGLPPNLATARVGSSVSSANVYVDGLNLYYGCLRGTPYRWLDIGELCRKLLPRNPINRIRYFTSRVSSRPESVHGPERQNAYLRALATTDGISIHLGHFQTLRARLPVVVEEVTSPRMVEVIKTDEKGSDVNLATYLLLDAFRQESDIAVVISNDSDLAEPIRVLTQELGVPVGLVNPHPAKLRSRDLLGLQPLFFMQIRPGVLRTCQFPRVLEDAHGQIWRPDGW